MTDIESLWRSQKAEDTVTLDNIHQNAERFQRRVRTGLAIEYGATVFVVIIFGFYIWVLPGTLVKAGSALCIAGSLFAVWQVHRRMVARQVPGLSGLGLVEFQTQELIRRRDALKSAWLWYILPVTPGMALMILGRWYQFHVSWRTLVWDHEVITLGVIIAVLIIVIVRLLQLVQVAKLQRKIDELKVLARS